VERVLRREADGDVRVLAPALECPCVPRPGRVHVASGGVVEPVVDGDAHCVVLEGVDVDLGGSIGENGGLRFGASVSLHALVIRSFEGGDRVLLTIRRSP
jgi:hypothetical protein